MAEDRLAPLGTTGGGLEQRLVRGLTWTIVQTWGGQGLSLIVFIVLARLLTPDDFGLVALAAVFVMFAQLIVDQGLGDALVQRTEIKRSHIDTAFWVALATAGCLTALALLVAGPLASLVGEPDLAPVLQVLSVTFPLSALTSVPIALLTRRLAFRLLAIRTILSIVGGGAVGVTMAYAGFGAWALVGQQVAAGLLSVITLWAVADWRPGLSAAREEFRELFGFGVRVVGSDILGFVGRNADNFLIGVFLGTVPLGLYAIGYRILDTSQRLLINVARKLTFPAFARLQHDPPRLGRAYLRVSRVANVVVLPGYVGLALVAPELTVFLFGSQWADSGIVAAVLFLSGPVLGLQAFTGSLLFATGHPEIVLRFRIVSTLATVVAFSVALPFGIVAVAAAFTLRAYAFVPLLLRWTHRSASISTRDYLAELRGIGLATLGMAVSVVVVKLLMPPVAPVGLLVAEAAVGAVTFIGLLNFADRDSLQLAWRTICTAVPGMSAIGRRLGAKRANGPRIPGDSA